MITELFLGTYTRRKSEGVYKIKLNTETKRLENLSLIAEIDNPTYVDTNKDQDLLFTIASINDRGGIASFKLQEDGTYKRIDEALADGVPPAYIRYDEDRQLIYTSNYHRGEVAVYRTDNEGNLELLDKVTHSGSSVHENQKSPHAHYSDLTPDNKYIVVCDLGTDEVYTYEVNDDGKLKEVARITVAAGTGPRHLVFHPTLDVAYIFGELSNDVIVVDYDSETGTFSEKQTISTIPEDHTTFNGGAAIRISSDGKFVYASNRGHESLVIYKTKYDGQLELVGYTPTEGETPRDFNLDPSEKFVIVGHQDSDNLTLFERNLEDGTLTLLQKDVYAPEVVCVLN